MIHFRPHFFCPIQALNARARPPRPRFNLIFIFMPMDLSFCDASNGDHGGSSSPKQIHVLMFPWLAHGHFSAFAELSKRIADQGVQVSFLTTSLNIPKVKPMLANHEKIQLLDLPLPAVEGLPKGIECTSDAPSHLWALLLRAVLLLEKPFENLLHSIPTPDFIVFDLIQYWTPKIAVKFGITTVLFLSFGAAYCSYELSPHRAKSLVEITVEELMQPPPGYPSSAISQHLFEARFSLNRFYAKDDSGNGMRLIDGIMSCIEGCNAIAIKSCSELEGKFIEYFERVTMKPVLPVGPLISPMSADAQGYSDCMGWLQKQQAGSVVYACFGSQSFLRKEQIHEVALGLEATQQPFILVLQLPNNFVFPEGFERRIEKSGLVLSRWAPQRGILSHPSTGVFMTHCGWNSVMEGLSNGVPLVTLPIQADQGLNARLIVNEWKVGVEVERDQDGFANKDEICKAVRRIMESKEMKHKACEIGKLFRASMDKGSHKMDKFVQYLCHISPEQEVGSRGK